MNTRFVKIAGKIYAIKDDTTTYHRPQFDRRGRVVERNSSIRNMQDTRKDGIVGWVDVSSNDSLIPDYVAVMAE